MNKQNRILSFVLIVQIILALVVFFPKGTEESAPTAGLLASFDSASVTEIAIYDSDENMLRLVKAGEGWSLPQYGDYPVDAFRVEELLLKISRLKSDRLIAQNSSSHNRLRVGENAFERRIELNDGAQTLFVGSSGGANAVHMRAAGSDNVYLTSGLASWEANTTVSSWIDTVYFSAAQDQITALRLENANGVFEFVKDGENWKLSDLAEGETFNTASFNTLLGRAASLRMSEPIGREREDRFELDAPQAVITLTVQVPAEEEEGEPTTTTHTLRVGAALDDANYVMHVDDAAFYVKVANSTATSFTEKTRADFLVVPVEEEGS